MNDKRMNILNTMPRNTKDPLSANRKQLGLKELVESENTQSPPHPSERYFKLNIQDCPWYEEDIIQYLRKAETRTVLPENFLRIQSEVNSNVRAVILDWIIDAHLKFKLFPETLYLTQLILDKYLSRVQVPRKILQLVAIASMMIACKYEEIYAPETSDFV